MPESKHDQKKITDLAGASDRGRQLVEAIDAITWLTDASLSRIVYLSPEFYELYGIPRGSNRDDVSRVDVSVHCDDQKRLTGTWPFHPPCLTSHAIEYRIVLPDGSIRWLHDRALPVRDDRGVVSCVLGITDDITARKCKEHALVEARCAAESASHAKAALLANMSHEIRTPMNAIIGLTNLLMDTPITLVQARYLELIKSSTHSLLHLLNDVLDLSKIEAQKLLLTSAPFDVRDLVSKTCQSLAPRAHAKGVELAFHVLRDVPDVVSGDPNRVRQVLVNLLGNAIKFTSAGEVVLRVELDAVVVEGSIPLRFSVTDTGSGISETQLGGLFQAFTQLDTSPSRLHAGAGLGLAISRELTEAMGGRIRVESRLGKGSTFSFVIPFVVPPEQPQPSSESEVCTVCGEKVLVIDDNLSYRMIVRESLTEAGFDVSVAACGDEGIGLAISAKRLGRPFRCVLVDANMPDMDGFEVAESLAAYDLDSLTLVMMLVSKDVEGDIARCTRLGTHKYLVKPFSQSELVDVLKAAMQGQDPWPASNVVQDVALVNKPELGWNASALVAEDNSANRLVITTLLRRQGFRVAEVSDGLSAVEVYRQESFAIIFMDVQMPGMDGLETTRMIRALERRRSSDIHVPIIGLTAHALSGDRESCLAAGMDDYLAKPFDVDHLWTVVMKHLGHRSSALQSEPSSFTAAAFDRMGQDKDLWDGVVHIFLQEHEERLTSLTDAMKRCDSYQTERFAHSLKGTLRLLGAEQAARICAKLERMGQERDWTECETVLAELRADVIQVAAYLRGAN